MNKGFYKQKYMFAGIFVFFIFIGTSCKSNNSNNVNYQKIDSLPNGLVKLKAAYPDFIDSIAENYLIWNDGTKLIYDDGIIKNDFDSLLNTADLQDQMEQKYLPGKDYAIPLENFDPGRIRNETFFRKMYGSSEKEVRKNLVTIIWLPKTVNKKLLVTKINGIDKKLISISNELENLPNFKKYIDNPGGAFYWRFIAGTERLSMHSFGIAIDINVQYSNYWKWDVNSKTNIFPYKNRIPLEIVEIFEKYNFIWGGKWYHYDTMHFEYRPELFD